MNETIQSLYSDLNIPNDYKSLSLDRLAAVDSRYLKDLKLNVGNVLKSKHLSAKEAAFLALATAINEKSNVLVAAFDALARKEGASDHEIAEVHACTSLMNTNNVFYRFRHYLPQNEYYNTTPAGMRMSIMMNPVLGKEFFELLSLAISSLNNCELCITSHEASVKKHGAGEARIFDTIRLVAVIKSLVIALA